jgi:hypothetical protein
MNKPSRLDDEKFQPHQLGVYYGPLTKPLSVIEKIKQRIINLFK